MVIHSKKKIIVIVIIIMIIKVLPHSSLVFELSGAGCKLLESQEWQ